MNFDMDISKDVVRQFKRIMGEDPEKVGSSFETDSVVFSIKTQKFPLDLEMHHIRLEVKTNIRLHPFSPKDSEWYILHINLSRKSAVRTVNSKKLEVQKFAPAGMLLYTPGTKSINNSHKGTQLEIVILRFHKSFLKPYLDKSITVIEGLGAATIFEDLDFRSEKLIREATIHLEDRMQAHAYILHFLAIFIQKLKAREKGQGGSVHTEDIQKLFKAAMYLRDPFAKSIPSIKELAVIAGMGTTKFKSSFKKFFGSPPIQYHQKIRMEYADNELQNKRKTPSVLSYELGYSHPSKFTIAYKKQFGHLPSRF